MLEIGSRFCDDHDVLPESSDLTEPAQGAAAEGWS